jgi:serine/threonine protein kinase
MWRSSCCPMSLLKTLIASRFERVGKLLASLNHPSIASMYGLEEFKGTHFLVLELIKGDTLADRLRQRPSPP